ncbi:MAG: hypothetical protein A2X49_08050 [Lentisphaerae bacterium GWF2_52_8]|nr:MAG: hypothetical protein A2X49_08050 [Lentisphaerae bacterium GWF2_52_8]
MKPRINGLFGILLLTAFCANCEEDAARILNDNFEKREIKYYIDQNENKADFLKEEVSIQKIEGEEAPCLLLCRCKVKFKPVPVQDSVKYRMSFESRADGIETIETNPDLKHFLIGREQRLPNREYYFLDAEMKPVGVQGKRSLSIHTLPFGKWHETEDVFYPPAKAAFIQVAFNAGSFEKASLLIRKLKFTPAADEGALNCNPAFKLGKYNYSGWPEMYSANFVEMDGKLFFEGGSGEPFPISEPGEYHIFAKGIPKNGEKAAIGIEFMDAQGKGMKGSSSVEPKPEGVSLNFKVPEGAKRAKLSSRNCIVEEVRVAPGGSTAVSPEKNKP